MDDMNDTQRQSLQQHIIELLSLCDLPQKELFPLCVITEDLYENFAGKGKNNDNCKAS